MFKNVLKILSLLLIYYPLMLRGQVYHIDISGTIDLGLPPYLERVISEAEGANAKLLLLEINTFGGRVDAATQIKDLLLNTSLETAAFIDKRAISAGAFIGLSCKTIGMVPGGSIGAATVVDGGGQKASEKMISYFRTEMGATAEHYGRNRKIAEGMVDEDIEIKGLSEKGKLITLTTDDALKWKIAQYTAPDLDAFLDSLELSNEKVVYSQITWAEQFVRFLTGPVISSFLLTLGFVGLLFEIKSPGWGVPGSLGVLCLALFFGSHYIISLANFLEIILFIIGVGLLLLEIFVIPGFGVAGISGILLMVTAVFLSLLGNLELITFADLSTATQVLAFALLLTVVGAVLVFRMLPESSFWKKISLASEQKSDQGYMASKDYHQYIGKSGVAVTPLRPSGTGKFDNQKLDVVSEGEFIDSETPIKIVNVEGYRLVVRKDS